MQNMDDLEYLVCHVAMLWRRLLHSQIKALGVTGTENRILSCIARYPGYTQVKIAHLLELEPQNLMRALDKLEARELVQKSQHPDDRRVNCLNVTSKGERLLQEIKKISDQLKPDIFASIPDEKLENLVLGLREVRGNLCRVLSSLNKD